MRCDSSSLCDGEACSAGCDRSDACGAWQGGWWLLCYASGASLVVAGVVALIQIGSTPFELHHVELVCNTHIQTLTWTHARLNTANDSNSDKLQ